MTLSLEERAVVARAKAIRKAHKPARPKYLPSDRPEQRKPRVREPAFLAFLRRQPCAVGPVGCLGAIEAAHIRMGLTGMQRKPDDAKAVPLCRGHHRDGPDAQHRSGERAWWAAHHVNPFALAAELHAQFKAQP